MNETELRERVLARFTERLDAALAAEGDPVGVAPELLAEPGESRDRDLYSLWTAVTTLAQEVKLQGRTFHELAGAVSGLPGALDGARAANERLLSEAREAREERALAGVLELLLDVRERLRRGCEDARAHVRARELAPPPGLLSRLLGARPPSTAEAERAFVRGYELALERLDDALRERGVEEIACVGRPFDPHTMRAVELAATPGAAEGTVVGVQRAGFTRRGEVLRAAEVVVVRGGQP